MDVIGKSPIPSPVLLTGKLALAGTVAFFFLRGRAEGGLLFESPAAGFPGLLLAGAGLLSVLMGIGFLGHSASVGLPREQTLLKTGGPYRFTRNPIYLGGILICTGSFLFAPHPLNLLCAVLSIGIHHWIVLREELFLVRRFGEQWQEYSARVPRYLGPVKRPAAPKETHAGGEGL